MRVIGDQSIRLFASLVIDQEKAGTDRKLA